jgi:antitoxin MazE
MKTTLQRWGNSQGIRLPKSMIDTLGMTVGTSVTVEVSGDQSQITIKPTKESRPIRGRHRIEDLVAESSPKAFSGENNWGPAQGKEVW